MIGDDDWETFFDPDEFGCEVRLVVGADVIQTTGMLTAAGEPDRLRAGQSTQGGVRAKPGERLLQIATRDLPSDWPERRVELDIGLFSAVEAVPIGRLRTGLILVPHSERTTSHGQWLRD